MIKSATLYLEFVLFVQYVLSFPLYCRTTTSTFLFAGCVTPISTPSDSRLQVTIYVPFKQRNTKLKKNSGQKLQTSLLSSHASSSTLDTSPSKHTSRHTYIGKRHMHVILQIVLLTRSKNNYANPYIYVNTQTFAHRDQHTYDGKIKQEIYFNTAALLYS